MNRAIAFVVGLSFVLGFGCGGSRLSSDLAQPPEYDPDQQTKCRVTESQLKPLVIEWPAAERSALEAQRQRGLAVVHYDGCEMELLTSCTAPGNYQYAAVTPKHENVSIRNADELYAAIPVYAASLEGKLERAGRLDVNMTIVGVYRSMETPPRDALQGDCARATHVVRALTVGAFEFSAGGSAQVGGEVGVATAGVGAKSATNREVLSSDGDATKCEGTVAGASSPPFGCGALLRIEVGQLSHKVESHAETDATERPVTDPAERPPLIDVLKR